MNEVFMYAAFGDPVARFKAKNKKRGKQENDEGEDGTEGAKAPYSIFDKRDLEEKMVRI
jgi:hypothetical protein